MSQITNNRRRRSIVRIVAVILLLVVVPAVYVVYSLTRDKRPTVNAAILESGDITSVMTINTVILPGEIQETSVSSQLVKDVLVSPGDQVRKGDVLVIFDLAELEDQLETAKEARAQAEEAAQKVEDLAASQAGGAQDALGDLQKQISRLSAGLSGATNAVTKLGNTSGFSFDIQDGLTETIRNMLTGIDPSSPDATTQIEAVITALTAGVRISTTSEYQAQVALLNQNLSKMSSAVNGLLSGLSDTDSLTGLLGAGSMGSQLQNLAMSAQTAVAQTIQAEKLAQEALDNAIEEIKAEIDGIVAEVNAVPGEYAGAAASSVSGMFGTSLTGLPAASEPVVVIYDNTRPKAFFQANRYDSDKLAVGMPVIYTQDGRAWTGRITHKGRIASNVSMTGTDSSGGLFGDVSSVSGLATEPVIDIEMSILGDELESLTLGFNLEAEIQTAHADNVLLLPAEAMKKELGEYYVFVMDQEGRLNRRVIKPGIQSDTHVEVLEGLSVGEKIVLNPTNDLTAGMLVKEKNNG